MQAKSYTEARKVARTLALANIPVFLWGSAGIGKSAMVADIAREFGADMIDLRLALFQPADLLGMPAREGDKTVFLRPDWFPADTGKPIFLFLDEIDRASRATKNVALQLILDRAIGGRRLPDSVRIFAAGNGGHDRGMTEANGAAVNNRFSHIAMRPDFSAWRAHAINSGWSPGVVAFLQMRHGEAGIFHIENPERDARAFPTARNWEKVNRALPHCSKADREPVIAAIVGDSVASECAAFLDIFESCGDLIARAIADPAAAPVFGQSEASKAYAMAIGLAYAATPGNFAAILQYAQRMPREFEILCAVSATRRDPANKETRAFVEYATRNQAVYK